MHVCTTAFSQTELTASGRPFSPSQTTIRTSRVPRFLISERTRSQNLAPSPSPCSPGPQAQDVPRAVRGDAEGHVDGPVGDLALADLDVDRIDEDHRVNGIERPGLPFGHPVHDPVGNGADGLLRDLRAVYLGEVRGDLPVGQPFRGQGNDHVLDPGKPPLPLGDDLRLEAGITVPRHGYLHRPGLGEHRLGAAAIAGIAAITPCRVVPAIAEVVVHLAFEGALDDHLGQLAEQAAVTGQLQPASPGTLGQLPQQLLISRRQAGQPRGPAPSSRHSFGVSSVQEVTPLYLHARRPSESGLAGWVAGGGPWLRRTTLRSGLVARVDPSGRSSRSQPIRWTQTSW